MDSPAKSVASTCILVRVIRDSVGDACKKNLVYWTSLSKIDNQINQISVNSAIDWCSNWLRSDR